MPRTPSEDWEREFMDTRGLMSKSARDRWNRETRAKAEAVLADLQAGRLGRVLARDARSVILDLDNAGQIDRYRREFLNALYNLREEPQLRDAATTPYVSPTDTRHIPTTTTHTHDHASHGHPDHDDGIHSHTHEHHGDADHDHVHGKPNMRPRPDSGGASSGPSGDYAAEISATGPAQRAAIRRQRIANLDARRGGSL
jgi:hypothetical protein